jgi:hypothetical protein
MSNQSVQMNQARKFFLRHAGYSFDPKTETRAQGRARGARQLADAEAKAKDQECWYRWEPDWECGSHQDYYGSAYDREPETCECCSMFDCDGELLANLGCIDDATAEYRRVVEAELALEVL